MTEISYLWNGTVTGDASQAPYDKEEFNKYIMLLQSTDDVSNSLYVIPSYLNDLRVYSDESRLTVTVAAGAAVMGSRYIYLSDSDELLNLDAISNSGYFRYDYVVLRLDTINQNIRLAVLKGSETNSSAALAEPILTQNELIREIPLARVYVDDTTTYIQDKYVHDLRIFSTNAYTSRSYKLIDRNMVVNSEWMAYSSSDGAADPEGWYQGAVTITATTKLSPMSRGQALSIVPTNEEFSLRQIIPVDPAEKVFTVKAVIQQVTGGDAWFSVSLYPGRTDYLATVDPGEIIPGTFKKVEYKNLVASTEVEVQFTVKLDDNVLFDNVLLDIAGSASDTYVVGQCIVVPGYHPGPFREFNETIMFRERITGTNWSDTAKSSGTTTIDVNAEFGIPMRTRGVFVRTRGRDSGSAGGTASLSLQGYVTPFDMIYGSVDLSGVTNDVYREATFFVPVDAPIYDAQDETPQMRAVVVATGAGTFDATLEIVGITT